MDCLMPNKDGYQATIEIRALEKELSMNKSTIVALTANASEKDKIKCTDSGMNDVVTKPFKKIDLINVINKWGKVIDICESSIAHDVL
ncbi:MAG: response regulator [Gammaproteobacteria bacterium]|nr:response regulator [Gammaproteobacteria bacterium]